MSPRTYTHVLIALAVMIMASSVWLIGRAQRTAVSDSFRQSEAAGRLLTGMLNQETGLRGYLNTGRDEFLEPFMSGERAFLADFAAARSVIASHDAEAQALLRQADEIATHWHASATEAINARRTQSRSSGLAETLRRKGLMDRFRATQGRLAARIAADREHRMDRVSVESVLLILGLSALFTAGGWMTFGRRAERRARALRREAARRDRQTTFVQTLQFMDSEEDAHRLVKRHLEGGLPGAEVVVMRRNNSADRLEAATPLEPAHPLAVELVDAQPRSCLAVRLGAEHRGGEPGELLQCDLCGKTEAELTTCTPLLVGGEVIGSVLVSHDGPLDEDHRVSLAETVTQAAPVVANMRNLAIAELRAATDALTGLPNRRAIQDTLRRMVAQAGRSAQPLAAVAIDLDHFKRINDRFGHDKGDDVLAAAAQTLTATLRGSDFVGRQGGEEFIVLLPETDLEGALVAAENLRGEIERIEIGGVDQAISASFGVAVLPQDALDADALLRQADRALYAAKDRGRNRVEGAGAVSLAFSA